MFNMKCPFCLNKNIEPKPGKTACPDCHTEFEIDDRLECVYADTINLRLPVNGSVCMSCGLVQYSIAETCVSCGIKLNSSLQ